MEGSRGASWIIPASIVLPVPLRALGIVQVIGLLNNVNSHLGYEFLPTWWLRVAPFRCTSSATYHNLHHQKLNGNFGLFFRFWDGVFGTEIGAYPAAFVDRRVARPPALGDRASSAPRPTER